MKRPIILVQGCKGGVGKSVVTATVMDWLEAQEIPMHLVESDTANSDVGSIYKKTSTPVIGLNLDADVGWMDLGNLCEKETERVIVVNTGARNLAGLQRYGSMMQFVQELRPVVSLWVLDSLEDSVSLLKDFLHAMLDDTGTIIGTVHALCNEGKTENPEREEFSIFESSNTAVRIRKQGASMRFPKLAERLVRELFTGERKTIGQLATTGALGNRAEAQRWRRLAHDRFRQLLGKLE